MLTTAELIDIRRTLHRIPEAGFAEFETQQALREIIAHLPPAHLAIEEWETGLLVRVNGTGTEPRRCIGYRTDIDGLPIPEETGLPFASEHPGWMHACGHDLHMTIALGVLAHFADQPPQHDLLFVFQPAEEGPGGALPMLRSAAFNAWRPDQMLALHVAPEYPVGTIATRPGLLFANTSELFIDLVGQGGHAAYPHRTRDMVVAAAHLITQLQTVVARNVDPLDSAVVTIGKLTGGTKQNIIAERSRLEGTIRTLSQPAMAAVKARIEALVRGVEAGFECTAEIDYGANYFQVWNDEALTRQFMSFVESSGTAQLVECGPAMTGEDFGYFLSEIPGFMFWLGVGTPFGLHHARMSPNEAAIEVGVRTVTAYLAQL
ncbi:MAG: N-acetyldiaminopimelate deacetylase [Alicyclobacillus sp.]|nr:N-acetyldiaminopimelate deacetylase [Alicyclobacillus sp.]